MGEEISRRDLLRGFHRIFGRSVAKFGKTVGKGLGKSQPARSPLPDIRLPAPGAPLQGIPFVHPWIGIAHAIGDRLGRRYPYVLLLGASGEAFRLSYRRDDALCALRSAPVNTFLACLAMAGLTAQSTHGGSFEPALGGAEVALSKGLAVAVGAKSGPAILLAVDRKSNEVSWVQGSGEPRRISISEFEEEWEAAWWTSGEAPFLRITAEKAAFPRSLDDVARVGLETMAMLLTRDAPGPGETGLVAYEAWAADLRKGVIPDEQAEILNGELLRVAAVGRLAAGRFLESIVRALPSEMEKPLKAAAGCYREIHNPDPTGEVWGNGLFPEVAKCLTTDDRHDPEKQKDPALRERAADLLLEIRDREAKALEHIKTLPPPLANPDLASGTVPDPTSTLHSSTRSERG